MKALIVALSTGVLLLVVPRKPVGPCEPYAEVCRHCTDCSQCGHCARDKGWCSVCFKK
jgi:hypothetical protein